jgi:hypothetical protein
MVGYVRHYTTTPNIEHNAEPQLFYPHIPHNTIKQLAAQAWLKYVVVAHPTMVHGNAWGLVGSMCCQVMAWVREEPC